MVKAYSQKNLEPKVEKTKKDPDTEILERDLAESWVFQFQSIIILMMKMDG